MNKRQQESENLRALAETSGDPGGLAAQVDSAKRVMVLLSQLREHEQTAPETQRLGGTPELQEGLTVKSELDQVEIQKTDIPATIGRFQIQSILGQGGFGLVFDAIDPDLQRHVALKVPTMQSLLNADALSRFEQEGRALAILGHPNIVPVFEVGNDGPISFIASALVDGCDLNQWVAVHGIPPISRTVKAMALVADAIEHAHQRGVIHRDLKPGNLLIELAGDKASFDPASIRVTDFGLAKLIGEQEETVTRTGSLLGTPAFAAPEQLSTQGPSVAGKVLESADVYSLGALLYFLLSGRAPFQNKSLFGLAEDIRTKDPARIDWIPSELEAIYQKAMEKDPAKRYRSAHAFAADLRNFADGRPVQARMPGLPGRLKKSIQRQPVVSGLIFLVIASVVSGLVASIVYAQRAATSAADSRQQYLESKQAINDYYVRISRDPLFLSASFSEQRKRLLDSATEHFIAFLDENQNDPQLARDLIQTRIYLAQTELVEGESAEAEKRFRDGLSELKTLLVQSPRDIELLRLEALCLTGLGKIQSQRREADAIELLTQAADLYRTLAAESSLSREWEVERVESLQALGNGFRNLGQKENAYQVAVEIQSVIETVQARLAAPATFEEVSQTAVLQNYLAISLGDQSLYQRDQQNDEAAMKLIGESIRLSKQLIAEQPNPIWYVEIAMGSYYRRAVMWMRRGQPDRALPDAEQAVAMSDLVAIHNQSPEFKDQAIAFGSLLAVCYQRTGKLDAALEAHRRNLQSTERLAKNFPENVSYQITYASVMANLMSALIDQLQLDEALDLNQRLNDFVTPLLGDSPNHSTYQDLAGMILLEKGRILHRLGSYRQAVDTFNETLNFVQQLRVGAEEKGDRVQFVFDNRSHAYFQLGELDKAIADRQKSFEMDPANVSYHQLLLAELYARDGQSEQALTCLDRVDQQLDGKPAQASDQMRQAFVYAALVDSAPESDPEIRRQHLQTAAENFLAALKQGYFRDSPARFQSLEQRPWLKPLLGRPEISVELERERAQFEPASGGK